jgi:hypothetical protein
VIDHDDENLGASLKGSADRVRQLPIYAPGVTLGESTPADLVEKTSNERRVDKAVVDTASEASNGKRVRKSRVLTNVSVLGEVHAAEAVDEDYLRDTDNSMLGANRYPAEPTTYAESLSSPECKYWRRARRNERHALEKKLLSVVRRPKG